ncbi:hypothetical protein DICA1_D04258 [Diutina catenulata]
MLFDVRCLHSRWATALTPVAVLLGMGYANFAVGWALGHQEIWQWHSHGVAISLWVLFGVCQALLYFYWVLIFYIGPGKQPHMALLDIHHSGSPDVCSVPPLFVCDENGYPYYESSAETITVARSFYCKRLSHQVLKYDHYCVWIGSVIGESNYLFFLKFMQWYLWVFVLVLIFTARYSSSSASHGYNWNFVVMLVMSFFWIVMIAAMLGTHIWYVSYDLTTLDEITHKQHNRWTKLGRGRKELGRRFVNVDAGEGRRAVVEYSIRDRVFDQGFRRNWINLVFNGNVNHGREPGYYTNLRLAGAFAVFLIPLVDIPIQFVSARRRRHQPSPTDPESRLAYYLTYSPHFSPAFVAECHDKIRNGDFVPAAYQAKCA